jgi:hypothetical protein
LEELATARSLTVAIMLRYGDYAGILSLKVDPRHYVSAEKYFCDAQATALLKKFRGIDVPGIDRQQAALEKWLEGERDCYRSNERLSKFIYGCVSTPADLVIDRFIRSVRKKILSWIGSAPPDLDKIEGRFGPGATFADRGRLTTVPDKMVSGPTLTPSAHWYLLPFWQTQWGRISAQGRRKLSWVNGNRHMTVPKTGLIDRSIAIEPAINVFYQLGLGTSLRRRLRNATGWDLDHAQDIHRAVARESSITREFATLDLSNASDTVCKNLVRLLLPPRWFEELSALRSPKTFVEKGWRVLEKFSSMGNGYTFELETLIFAAILSSFLDSPLIRRNHSSVTRGFENLAEATSLKAPTLDLFTLRNRFMNQATSFRTLTAFAAMLRGLLPFGATFLFLCGLLGSTVYLLTSGGSEAQKTSVTLSCTVTRQAIGDSSGKIASGTSASL